MFVGCAKFGMKSGGHYTVPNDCTSFHTCYDSLPDNLTVPCTGSNNMFVQLTKDTGKCME